ncbi:MAG: HEAT repeat domain-containing protein [Candidatus Korarchaeum sp.]
MEIKEDENCILIIYELVSLLLSYDYETVKLRVEDILNEYTRNCLAKGESREKFSSFISDVIAYAKSKEDVEGFLKLLRGRILEDRELRELATLVFREICNAEVARICRGWGEDLEPAVRMAYLKCLLKLFERGEVGVEEFGSFIEDPSPKIRLTLASALSLHADRSEVRSLLLRMLGKERRSEVRNVIIESLSIRKNLGKKYP